MKLRNLKPKDMTEVELLEALSEDDPWLKRYPTIDKYLTDILSPHISAQHFHSGYILVCG